jgi:hypothetical protein
MNSSQAIRPVVTLVAVLLLAGPSVLAGTPEIKPVYLNAKKPALVSVEGFPEEVTKGDLSIRCLPAPFLEKVVYHRTLKEKPKGLISLSSGTAKKYLVTEEPVGYAFEPDHLTFQLRIANNTGHVLRFTDCLLSLLIDNQQAELDAKAEAQLRKTVILPHGTAELTVLGPKAQADRVGDTTRMVLDTAKIIMLSIYDVTIAVDAANNPTEKATFEWIFENKPVVLNQKLEAVTTEEKLESADAQKLHNQWYFK